MKIANIVVDNKIKLNNKFNIVKDFTDIIENKPTLIIGLNNVKKLNINLDFLDRKISENIFWTFNKTEKRLLFEEDLYSFQKKIYDDLKKNNNYFFIDFILESNNFIKKFINDLKYKDNIITYQHKNMLYMLFDSKIHGIDLNQLKYIGKNLDKTLKYFNSVSNVFLYEDGKNIKFNNDLEMFNYEVKYIPLIYKINK